MNWGFKKQIKIAPGMHINVGKKGLSARVGGRAAGVTVGTSGARASANLPGTGLSIRKNLGGSAPTAAPITPETPPFKATPKPRKWSGLIIIFAGIATGIALIEIF